MVSLFPPIPKEKISVISDCSAEHLEFNAWLSAGFYEVTEFKGFDETRNISVLKVGSYALFGVNKIGRSCEPSRAADEQAVDPFETAEQHDFRTEKGDVMCNLGTKEFSQVLHTSTATAS